MASDNDFNIGHLFAAGVVTAAGAAFFWWILKQVTADKQDDDEDLELEAMLLASSAREGVE
jgi:hypothetical protein